MQNDQNKDCTLNSARKHLPDSWVVVKITKNKDLDSEEILYKIFCSENGGFMTGSSWRLNSGITKVENKDSLYFITGYSGSIYICSKNNYGTHGMTKYTVDVLNSILQQLNSNSNKGGDTYNAEVLEVIPDWFN